MRTLPWLSLAALSAFLGCIDNPAPDPRIGSNCEEGAECNVPVPPPPPQNLGATIQYPHAEVRFHLTKTSVGIWTLVARNLSDAVAPRATLLLQIAPPTSFGFGRMNAPDFYVYPFHEEVLQAPAIQPGQQLAVREIPVDPSLTAQDLYVKMLLLQETPPSDPPAFAASGLYRGEYWRLVGDSLVRIGTAKGVIDASGRMGFILVATRPNNPSLWILGAYRDGVEEELEYVYVEFAGETARELPVGNWRREANGYALRMPLPDGDSAEMRIQRVETATE